MAFDQNEWNRVACTIRCLLELVRRHDGRIINPADFVEEHIRNYPIWAVYPGASNTIVTCELAKELLSANVGMTFIDPDRIAEETQRPGYLGTLLFTERQPNENDRKRLDLVCHTMLAIELTNWRYFKVWNPLPNGTAQEDNQLSWKRWNQWQMHGLVLSRLP